MSRRNSGIIAHAEPLPSTAVGFIKNDAKDYNAEFGVVMPQFSTDIEYYDGRSTHHFQDTPIPTTVMSMRPAGGESYTKLFVLNEDGEVAPFPGGNVYEGTGNVCWGGTRSPLSLRAGVNTFWASPFNSDLTQAHSMVEGLTLQDMLEEQGRSPGDRRHPWRSNYTAMHRELERLPSFEELIHAMRVLELRASWLHQRADEAHLQADRKLRALQADNSHGFRREQHQDRVRRLRNERDRHFVRRNTLASKCQILREKRVRLEQVHTGQREFWDRAYRMWFSSSEYQQRARRPLNYAIGDTTRGRWKTLRSFMGMRKYLELRGDERLAARRLRLMYRLSRARRTRVSQDATNDELRRWRLQKARELVKGWWSTGDWTKVLAYQKVESAMGGSVTMLGQVPSSVLVFSKATTLAQNWSLHHRKYDGLIKLIDFDQYKPDSDGPREPDTCGNCGDPISGEEDNRLNYTPSHLQRGGWVEFQHVGENACGEWFEHHVPAPGVLVMPCPVYALDEEKEIVLVEGQIFTGIKDGSTWVWKAAEDTTQKDS